MRFTPVLQFSYGARPNYGDRWPGYEELAQAAEYSYSTFFRHFDRKEDVLFYDFPERLAALRLEFTESADSSTWQSLRRAFVADAAEWAYDEAEFHGARLRMIHEEPALFARFIDAALDEVERGLVRGGL